ncbi:MAG: UTP--glucose-1-phosphate uridylyltransferase [Candidatus Colwellbacteria bacterium CG10_big_fil_rev_8_21_14_0_10_42_22]|uniref:UTP--glucose-1-phosphate uridylyltransferase n=1 Tax=Candidatus Colwellbacteria bacterium CG10_big_fil_rev_8_21_14_0_10_42_22 TaxID=1974540 RepID=A0A2H0VFJ1_9BACT|nr:MAG: UTP--glucose-1-phosphate uridylyltransferase [Candidatus Colwellbacteria bacterium CG10_big_fil_rev_8_21_14_0_10_42_22]
MQAVILAAGEGSRLRPFTDNLPKPMVNVSGKPILERTLDILPDEIEEVVLIVGYKKEKIIEHFGDEYRRIKITYAEQKERKGTYDALLCAEPFLKKGFFLLLQGDELYHPFDLKRCVESEELAALVIETEHPERFGICIPDENDYVVKIIEKPTDAPGNLASIGAFLLHTDIFKMSKFASEAIPGEYVLAEHISKWVEEVKMKMIRATFWYTISSHEDVYIADKFLGM